MICPQCNEQIEVGEALEEAVMGNKTRYFHVGHLRLYLAKIRNHYETEVSLDKLVTRAGTVH